MHYFRRPLLNFQEELKAKAAAEKAARDAETAAKKAKRDADTAAASAALRAKREIQRQEERLLAHRTAMERKAIEAQALTEEKARTDRSRLEAALKSKAIAKEKSARKKHMRLENKARKKAPLPFDKVDTTYANGKVDVMPQEACKEYADSTRSIPEEGHVDSSSSDSQSPAQHLCSLIGVTLDCSIDAALDTPSSSNTTLTLAAVALPIHATAAPESTVGGDTTCIICMTNPKTHIAAPCGHQCACNICCAKMEKCPYCCEPVIMWVKQRLV